MAKSSCPVRVPHPHTHTQKQATEAFAENVTRLNVHQLGTAPGESWKCIVSHTWSGARILSQIHGFGTMAAYSRKRRWFASVNRTGQTKIPILRFEKFHKRRQGARKPGGRRMGGLTHKTFFQHTHASNTKCIARSCTHSFSQHNAYCLSRFMGNPHADGQSLTASTS